jgi:rubredoxin
MSKYVCLMCGYIYDESVGIPEKGIPAGTKWSDLPADWQCPICGSSKSEFKLMKEETTAVENKVVKKAEAPANACSAEKIAVSGAKIPAGYGGDDLRQMSCAEMSALCSNLARGCEKQYLAKESLLFTQLADYYQSKVTPKACSSPNQRLMSLINKALDEEYPVAMGNADGDKDRGAKRVITWSSKVTTILQTLLEQYDKKGDKLLENTNVYVCDICGFIYIGDNPPAVCPICKVPSFKLIKIPRK